MARKINDRISTLPTGMLEVNCYLVKGKSGTLYIIDPGGDAEDIAKAAKEFDATEKVILLTHGHVDHISGIRKTMDLLGISKVFIHEDDIKLYKSPDNHLMPFVPAAKDLPEPEIVHDTEDFTVIHTPGHSRGGCCFYFKDMNTLFSGDTIFMYSIGRSDLPGGDQDTLIKSINEKIMTLPPDTVLYPGHGPSTTVADEKRGNPYI